MKDERKLNDKIIIDQIQGQYELNFIKKMNYCGDKILRRCIIKNINKVKKYLNANLIEKLELQGMI